MDGDDHTEHQDDVPGTGAGGIGVDEGASTDTPEQISVARAEHRRQIWYSFGAGMAAMALAAAAGMWFQKEHRVLRAMTVLAANSRVGGEPAPAADVVPAPASPPVQANVAPAPETEILAVPAAAPAPTVRTQAVRIATKPVVKSKAKPRAVMARSSGKATSRPRMLTVKASAKYPGARQTRLAVGPIRCKRGELARVCLAAYCRNVANQAHPSCRARAIQRTAQAENPPARQRYQLKKNGRTPVPG